MVSTVAGFNFELSWRGVAANVSLHQTVVKILSVKYGSF